MACSSLLRVGGGGCGRRDWGGRGRAKYASLISRKYICLAGKQPLWNIFIANSDYISKWRLYLQWICMLRSWCISVIGSRCVMLMQKLERIGMMRICFLSANWASNLGRMALSSFRSEGTGSSDRCCEPGQQSCSCHHGSAWVFLIVLTCNYLLLKWLQKPIEGRPSHLLTLTTSEE